MKIFLDSNVLISAFITQGTCRKIFEQCLDLHEMYISPQVEKEFTDFLVDKRRFVAADAKKAISTMMRATHKVPDGRLEKAVSRDKDDDPILAAAFDAGVDCLLTGDGDLSDLKKFHTMPIVRPSDFWEFEHSFDK